MNREDVIIGLYLIIDGALHDILGSRSLRSCGRVPGLSDAEALTVEIFGEMFGHHDDAAIWRYAKAHWQDWFPGLGSYKAFVKQCANLVGIKQALFSHLFAPSGSLHITDGVPMPICHLQRASRCKLFPEQVAFGFCAAKNEPYYGFKGHVVINQEQQIVAFTLAPANIDEREVVQNMIGMVQGCLIGDKGLLSKILKEQLAQHGLNLQTPLRNNMPDSRPKAFVQALLKIRRNVETVIGQLTEHFAFAACKAKTLWHLNARLLRKLCAYNLSLKLC